MKYKEHLPSNMMWRRYKDKKPTALCGQKNSPIILNMFEDNDTTILCKKCMKIACEDCFGTGIINGGWSGLYCHCQYGDLRELNSL